MHRGLRLEDHFYRIMNMIDNKQWKQFARATNGLSLAAHQVDDIQADYENDVREQKYQMLSLWQRRNGGKATIGQLENLVQNFRFQIDRVTNEPIPRRNPGGNYYVTEPVGDGAMYRHHPVGDHTDSMLGRSEVDVHHDSSLNHAFASIPQNERGDPERQYEEIRIDRNRSNEGEVINIGRESANTTPKLRCMPMDPLGFIANSKINIHVHGKYATGIKNTVIMDSSGRETKQKSKSKRVQDFAKYCSRVKNIDVSISSEALYEDHLDDPGSVYRMSHNPKGSVLIINNSFQGEPDERKGSEVDVSNMESLWVKLGCKTYLQTEITAAEILEKTKRFVTATKTCSSDFVAVVVMSHGGRVKGEDIFYGINRDYVTVKEMLELFNNKNSRRLLGIPKLFFFQVCRGTDIDQGAERAVTPEEMEASFSTLSATVHQCSEDINDTSDAIGVSTTKEPTMSDTLVSFATQAGHRSFRNNSYGSWFINAITNIFMKHAKDEHVLDMMTKVNQAVAAKTAHNPDDTDLHDAKEMSDFTSTLRKKLYFFPGFPDDSDI